MCLKLCFAPVVGGEPKSKIFGGQGLEPRFSPPKGGVLPLDDPPTRPALAGLVITNNQIPMTN